MIEIMDVFIGEQNGKQIEHLKKTTTTTPTNIEKSARVCDVE